MTSKTMYHTQEYRGQELTQPISCCRDDAWLGEGYYFWYDETDAHYWGKTSKKRTGQYEIYKAKIELADVLDTVFNQEHYFFWLEQIEKIALYCIGNGLGKPTLKELNDYLKEKATWDEVKGILFQDLPDNPENLLVKPIRYKQKVHRKQGVNFTIETPVMFNYRKRIQIAVYNLSIMSEFQRIIVENCNTTK